MDDTPLLLTNLDDLEDEVVTMVVSRPHRRSIQVSMKPLSYLEWVKFDWEIPIPQPSASQIIDYRHGGLPVYNLYDPAYTKLKEEADAKRGYARLIASLQLEIKGDTLEGKIAALESKLDYGAVRAMITKLGQMATQGAAVIEDTARSFSPTANGHSSDHPSASERPEMVAHPNGIGAD